MPVASKESHRVVVSYPCPNDCFFRLSGGSANNSRAERRGWRRRLRLAEGAPRSGSARQQRDRNRQCAEQKAALAIDVLSHKCSQCRGAAEQLGPGGCLPTVLAGGALAGAAPPPPPSPASRSPPRSGGTSCGGLLMRWQVPHGGGRTTTSHVVEIVTARFFRFSIKAVQAAARSVRSSCGDVCLVVVVSSTLPCSPMRRVVIIIVDRDKTERRGGCVRGHVVVRV